MSSTGVHPPEAFRHVKAACKSSSRDVYRISENLARHQNADGPSVCPDHGNPHNVAKTDGETIKPAVLDSFKVEKKSKHLQ